MSANREIEYPLVNLFKTLWKRKWWAVAAFIVVLAVGIIISFIKTPIYNAEATIRVTNNYVYYNDIIYKYFPEEARDFWIFPTGQDEILEKKALYRVQDTIESGKFLGEVSDRMGSTISKDGLVEIISFRINESERYLKIYVTYDDPGAVVGVIDTIFGLIIENREVELDVLRLELIDKIEVRAGEIKAGIEEMGGPDPEASDTLTRLETDALFEDYYDLNQIRDSLAQNKELFTNRLEIIGQPDMDDVEKVTSLKRDLVISVFAALLIGIIVAFIVNFFISMKKEN